MRGVAVAAAAVLLAGAGFLAFDRGGLLAWLGVVFGALLLAKSLLRPAPRDAVVALAFLGSFAITWGAAWAYVVSTWESGEVVELEVDGDHVARVWVVDLPEGPIVYYDAPSEVAERLLAGAPVALTRDGHATRACAAATRAEDVSEERMAELIGHMEDKYAGRTTATTVFYVALGVSRDRVGVLIRLAPCG